jgi:hypothetical protein
VNIRRQAAPAPRARPRPSSIYARLLRLDLSVFEEVRAEPATLPTALSVVFCASLAAGLGTWLWGLQSAFEIDEIELFVKAVLIGSVFQTLTWLAVWVGGVYWVLRQAYGAEADFWTVARTMGFAFAPVAASLLIVLDLFAVPFGILSFGATLLLTNAAVQTAGDVEFREASVANLAGFAPFLIIMGVWANMAEIGNLGGLAPGILFFTLDL